MVLADIYIPQLLTFLDKEAEPPMKIFKYRLIHRVEKQDNQSFISKRDLIKQ